MGARVGTRGCHARGWWLPRAPARGPSVLRREARDGASVGARTTGGPPSRASLRDHPPGARSRRALARGEGCARDDRNGELAAEAADGNAAPVSQGRASSSATSAQVAAATSHRSSRSRSRSCRMRRRSASVGSSPRPASAMNKASARPLACPSAWSPNAQSRRSGSNNEFDWID